MLRVGLTGGYATGKSFVASELERLGCHVIRADELGHAVLEPGGEAYGPTVSAFGSGILKEDGTIDRKALAAIVFEKPELLEKLSGFVHPAVARLEEQMMRRIEAENSSAISVYEAAILIETGRYSAYDRLILTACDEETQVARAMKRNHATREEVLARLAKQLPLKEKQKYADYVIETGGTKQETVRQVLDVYSDLKRLAAAAQSE